MTRRWPWSSRRPIPECCATQTHQSCIKVAYMHRHGIGWARGGLCWAFVTRSKRRSRDTNLADSWKYQARRDTKWSGNEWGHGHACAFTYSRGVFSGPSISRAGPRGRRHRHAMEQRHGAPGARGVYGPRQDENISSKVSVTSITS